MRTDPPVASTHRPAAWRMRLAARIALLLGRTHAAEAAFDALIAAHPADAHARASRAHLRAQRGDGAGAVADLRAIPEPRAADRFNLGYLLGEEGRDAEAEAAFREALALDDTLHRAWYGLGLVFARADRLDEAVAAFERHTALQPLNPCGWYRLAHVHRQRGDATALAEVIARVRAFEPRVAAQLVRETA